MLKIMFQGANTDEEYRRKLKNRNKLTDARGHLSAGRRTRGLWIHGLVLFFDLGETVGSSPLAVSGGEDCLVREGTCAAFAEGCQCLIETIVVKEAKDDHRGGKLWTIIAALSRDHIFYTCKYAQRLVVVCALDTFQADAQRKQRHLQL